MDDVSASDLSSTTTLTCSLLDHQPSPSFLVEEGYQPILGTPLVFVFRYKSGAGTVASRRQDSWSHVLGACTPDGSRVGPFQPCTGKECANDLGTFQY